MGNLSSKPPKIEADHVNFVFCGTVNEGVKLEDLESFATEISKNVESTEAGTLAYEVYLSYDKKKISIYEFYASSQDFITHFDNMTKETLEKISFFVTPTGMDVCGAPNEAAKEVLERFHPVYHYDLAGFKRPSKSAVGIIRFFDATMRTKVSTADMGMVHWVYKSDIKEGKLEEFKELAIKDIKAYEEQDESIMHFFVHPSKDGMSAIVYERYKDSAAALKHIDRVANDCKIHYQAVTTGTGLDVYGSPSSELKSALERYASSYNPVYYQQFTGFNTIQ